ncbi:hypothetical protein DES53_101904 [Roseimicrobium gellanilyticum]|uniref:Uncharacterized protein n=1 Tax=Roseimicrobium gellanilyticum TaxID=748857 RepID=A0A366HX10_9BACT|nr:hypothetical protein [Roseimicrobium gellanilyticum]RBP48104.1 hypothetical protein DES53_101904 [Roseimicrobium gellanilyticum]
MYHITSHKMHAALVGLLGLAALAPAWSEDAPVITDRGGRVRGNETLQDLPSDFHPYYGQKLNRYRDLNRRIAKLDLDADLNMDGVIRQGDPRDSGAFESTPPGLILGVGELTKVVVNLIPYRIDFAGDVVIGFEVGGINRNSPEGVFSSFEEEQRAVGRIRVWRDSTKKELLLDSADPARRIYEFSVDAMRYPANLPDAIPRTIFVEGVKTSGAYLGDMRLLATVSHREKGQGPSTTPTADKAQNPPFKRFRTAFDHILITVEPQPAKKEYVNNNAEGVWVTPSKKSK